MGLLTSKEALKKLPVASILKQLDEQSCTKKQQATLLSCQLAFPAEASKNVWLIFDAIIEIAMISNLALKTE